jgi:hypothetical protein
MGAILVTVKVDAADDIARLDDVTGNLRILYLAS